jgi:biopolymer transport protein ExbB
MLTIIFATGWPIWPLLLISIIGLAILLERTWFLQKNRIAPQIALEQALTLAIRLNDQHRSNSVQITELSAKSILGKILAAGLNSISLNQDQLKCLEAMREVAGPCIKELNKYLNALATIATLAPLMGLFGTVLGMIEIFASQGGTSNPTQLAQGISMALYNTAFGLLIAIPAIAGWRFLRGMANNRQDELNEATRLFIKANFDH